MENKLYDDQLIIITGAAGFIGSGVVSYLNEKGFSNLLLVDDFGMDLRWKNLTNKKFVDFISRYELMDFLEGRESEVESIIHLGACSDTTEVDGDYFMDTNYRYSVELAEYALKNKIRFIYASSAATYGDGCLGFSDEHELLDSYTPLNIYGFSKHMFDLWLLRQNVLDQVVGLKYFNIFGPNENHKGRMASMVYHMTNAIEKEGLVKLFKSNNKKYKDGDQERDFFYVKDAVAITCSFLENDLNGIFNVGSGKAHTWNELAKATFAANGKKANIEYIPMAKDLEKNYQNHTQADLTKYHMMLKKNGMPIPKIHSLEDAVTDTVQNYYLKDKKW